MAGIFMFNSHLLCVITGIVLLVGWVLLSILGNSLEYLMSRIKLFNHSNVIEIIWTTFPALLLINLSNPSISLLYGFDDWVYAGLTCKVSGHQWYWGYETSDFISCSNTSTLKYSSYILSEEFLVESDKLGYFRNLETNRRFLLPALTHLRVLFTSSDVLHSWTVPSFGVKVDSCPGRLNEAHTVLKRAGVFFGQCSEICGLNHGFMPVTSVCIDSLQYRLRVMENLYF